MTTQVAPFWTEDGEIYIDLDDPSLAWSRISIGGRLVPGLATVSGDGIDFAVEKKKSQGASGATTTFNGANPVGISIVLRLWTAEQWEDFQGEILPLLQLRPGAKYAALAVDHPALAVFGITSLAIEKVSLPKIEDGVGTIEIKASQWRPAKGTGSQTPKTSTAKPVKTVLDVKNTQWATEWSRQSNLPTPPPPPSYTDTKPNVKVP